MFIFSNFEKDSVFFSRDSEGRHAFDRVWLEYKNSIMFLNLSIFLKWILLSAEYATGISISIWPLKRGLDATLQREFTKHQLLFRWWSTMESTNYWDVNFVPQRQDKQVWAGLRPSEGRRDEGARVQGSRRARPTALLR